MKNCILFTFGFFLLTANFSCKNKQNTQSVVASNQSETELKTLLLDGYKMNYIDIGEGEPVVFVHGTISDYRVWGAQMATFSENYRVIALSRRYAYPNDQTIRDSNDYSITAHAKDLVDFLKKLNAGPVHLVGHSFGGFTSLVATLDRPDLIKSLTLLEPPVFSLLENISEAEGLTADFIQNAVIPASKAFNENDDEAATASFVEEVMGDSLYFDKAPQNEKSMWLANTTELKAIASGADLFPLLSCQDLDKLEVPVLLIKGEHSPDLLRFTTDQLHKCIKHSKLKELPNATHGLQHQNPEGFNKIVYSFIEKH